MRKALGLGLLLAIIIAGGVSAQVSWTSWGNGPVQGGDFLLNAALDIGMSNSNMKAEGAGLSMNQNGAPAFLVGGSFIFDWALPIQFPLSVGLEVAFDYSVNGGITIPSKDSETGKDAPLDFKATVLAIPVMARVAYHPYFGVKGLDTYLLFKIGYVPTSSTTNTELGDWKDPMGLAVGGAIGVRYFFNKYVGIFGEFGYTAHILWRTWAPHGFGNLEYKALQGKFATIGISYKL
jgi:hypothetical protein